MAKITIEELSGSLKEYLNGLGLTEAQVQELIDKFEDEKIGDISQLSTEEKGSLVGAINELFQNANNGKELIASAIGEPLNADDTFSAMSNDINGLLSTFKTNMMNNGVTVESSDRFKSLIDKIATMVEEGSGKGIQFAEGNIEIDWTGYGGSSGGNDGLNKDYTFDSPLSFTPTYFFVLLPRVVIPDNNTNCNHVMVSNIKCICTDIYDMIRIDNLDNNGFTLYLYGAGIDYSTSNNISSDEMYTMTYYAIGVGEEDTTLRDSLASILEEEGVSVTEEDDMASLISKVEGNLVPTYIADGEHCLFKTGFDRELDKAPLIDFDYECLFKGNIKFKGVVTNSQGKNEYWDSYFVIRVVNELGEEVQRDQQKFNGSANTVVTRDVSYTFNVDIGYRIQAYSYGIRVGTSNTEETTDSWGWMEFNNINISGTKK